MSRFVETPRVSSQLTLAVAYAIAALFAVAVCMHGIPALRHDWWWPVTRFAFFDSLSNFTSGWIPNGIGYPSALPGDYMVGSVVSAIGLAAGPLATLAGFSFAIALTCALSARALCFNLSGDPLRIAAAQLFAVFNPWVYSQTVAGHTFMILAYGALVGVVAEGLKRRPNGLAIALLVLLIVPQIQFFIIAVVALAVIAITKKTYIPLISAGICALPLLAGYTMERTQLLQTPYTMTWQSAQSVDLTQAALLMGYFAQYTSRFTSWQVASLWLITALCLGSVFFARDRARAIGAGAVAASFIVIAAGLRGPLALPYAWAVAHVPQSAVYRELYDVLGITAAAYIALFSMPLRRFSGAAGAVLLAATVMAAAGWLVYPPSSYWIDSRSMPIVAFDAAPNTRFALVPPFQPMTFEGRGSGADRDTYRRPDNVTPLNEYLSTYPADAALSGYVQYGNTAGLQALSVSTVVERPWLSADMAALKSQVSALPNSLRSRERAMTLRRLRALPELTLGAVPLPGSLDNAIGTGNILASDAAVVRGAGVPASWSSLPAIVPVNVSNNDVSAAAGWVAAQFAFIGDPADAQGIGGAVTTNARAALPVRGGLDTLVSIRGRLHGAGPNAVWKSTRGYTWIHLPASVDELYCDGRCFVAAQAEAPIRPLPLNPPPRPYHPVAFHAIFPFLVRADAGTGQGGLLRYNVRYDAQWAAYSGTNVLPHARIDAIVNGWILPASQNDRTVLLVERTAFLQFIFECIAMLWASILLAVYAVRGRRFASITRS